MKRTPLRRKTKLKKLGGRRAWWLKRSIEWSKAVKARDGRCQYDGCQGDCGPLQAHHVFPKGSYPSVRFLLANGLTLGKQHHAQWHQASATHRRWWRVKFPERALEVQISIDERRAMREPDDAAVSDRGGKRRRKRA